jgi:hypothetical protein
MSIRPNPEYGATHWLNNSPNNTVRNLNNLQAAGSQAPVFETQAMGTTGNDEWDTGIPKYRERPRTPDYPTSLAMGTTGNDEWDTGIPKSPEKDPYYMVQNPWLNQPVKPIQQTGQSWYF